MGKLRQRLKGLHPLFDRTLNKAWKTTAGLFEGQIEDLLTNAIGELSGFVDRMLNRGEGMEQ